MHFDAPKPLWDRLLSADTILRLMFVLVFAAFLQTLTFELVYDDFTLITMNPWLQSVSGLKQIFTHHSWAFADGYVPARHYRPMFLVWLWLVQNVFGASPAWFHLCAIFTHLAAGWLAYRFALRLFSGDTTSAALVALLFALHPTKAETVGWIAAVTESLLAVFMLAGFLAYLNIRRNVRPYLWMAVFLICFAGALLTKETAVFLPVLIVAYELLLAPAQGGRLRFAKLASYLALSALVLALFLVARAAALRGIGDSAIPPSLSSAFFTAPLALCLLIRQMVWPIGLSALYPTVVVPHFSWKYFFAPALAIALMAILFWLWARKSPLLKFAAAWFLIPLIPVIGEFNWVQLHDRHLYLPSFGIAIMAIVLVKQIKWPKNLNHARANVGLVIIISIALAVLSAREVRIWESSVSVFTRAVQVAPTNLEAIEQLAETYYTTGNPERAFEILRDGLTVLPTSPRLTYALAHDLYQSGRYAEARPYYEKLFTLRFDPVAFPSGHFDLGMIELKNGNHTEAEEQLKQAVELAPGVVGYQRALARLQARPANREN